MSDESGKSLYKLQDPTKQYPQPKFRRQTQTAPRSNRKIIPRPDHSRLRTFAKPQCARNCGDSGIGRAAAIALARGQPFEMAASLAGVKLRHGRSVRCHWRA